MSDPAFDTPAEDTTPAPTLDSGADVGMSFDGDVPPSAPPADEAHDDVPAAADDGYDTFDIGNPVGVQSTQDLLRCSVQDPKTESGGMRKYVSYLVVTNTSMSSFGSGSNTLQVRRRYRDFLWLRDTLAKEFPHVIVPSMPSKDVMSDNLNVEFVEKRRSALEKMLVRMTKVPDLANSSTLHVFLESENAANLGTSKNKFTDVSKGLSAFSFKSVKNSFAKVEMDAYFADKEHYTQHLMLEFDTVTNAIAGVIDSRRGTASSVKKLSEALALLGNVNLPTALARAIHDLSQCVEDVYAAEVRQSADEEQHMLVPVRDWRNMSAAYAEFLEARRAAEAFQITAAKDVDSAKGNLASCEQNPKKAAKVPAAKEKLQAAEREEAAAVERNDKMKKAMKTESDRFDKDLVADFGGSLLAYTKAQVEHHRKQVAEWERAVEVMETLQANRGAPPSLSY